MHVLLALLALLAPTASPQPSGGDRNLAQRRQEAVFVTCTPRMIKINGERPVPTDNPIKDALEAAAPGCVITLKPGDYPGFTLGFEKSSPTNARATGGLPGRPVSIVGEGRVRIKANPRYGDTISINQQIKNGNIVFRNLIIEPGYRAAVLFFKQGPGRTHDNFQFLDCHILGAWNHLTDSGTKSKWGVWGHSLRNFEFRGLKAPARVENIQQEHGFYIQNPQGPVLIENVRATRLGRTFCQFTARAKDGMPGIGAITVRDCDVSDIGLSKWDNHKGGYAFTFAGRLTGDILLEGNRYRAGFDSELRRLTKHGSPYGTGALVFWDGGEAVRNASVTIRDNDFEFASGCGDRSVVSIGGCGRVSIVGENRFVSGGDRPALSLDPPVDEPGSRPKSARNGSVHLDKDTRLVGDFMLEGREPSTRQLMEMRKRPRGIGGRRER